MQGRYGRLGKGKGWRDKQGADRDEYKKDKRRSMKTTQEVTTKIQAEADEG